MKEAELQGCSVREQQVAYAVQGGAAGNPKTSHALPWPWTWQGVTQAGGPGRSSRRLSWRKVCSEGRRRCPDLK